jgi:hypothetical protein
VSALAFLLAIAAFALPERASASFINYYDLGNFTLLNTEADGSAITPDGGLTVELTGGNNGSGLPGQTDLVILAAAAGSVTFNFSLFTEDDPAFDEAGWLLGGIYTPFAAASGAVGFSVAAGQAFGFRVLTDDNQFGALTATLSNFEAPVETGAVPEPSYFFLGGGCLAAFGLIRRRLRGNHSPEGQS